MSDVDALEALWDAYRAHVSERTGLSWAQIETMLEAEREFWAERPGARALMEGLGLEGWAE